MAKRPKSRGKRPAKTVRKTAGKVRMGLKKKTPVKATPKRSDAPPVVGVGASAGGLKAFQTFVQHIPANSGIAWVLVQHLAPDRESFLADILQRQTKLS